MQESLEVGSSARTTFAGRGQSPVALVLVRMPAQVGDDLALQQQQVRRARPPPGFTVRAPWGSYSAFLQGRVGQNEAWGDPAGF